MPDRSFEALDGAWIKYESFSGVEYLFSAQPESESALLEGFSLKLWEGKRDKGQAALFTLPVVRLNQEAQHE